MKTAAQWFEAYGRSHCHPTNKLIHWICVPAIVWSVLGLLWPLGLGGIDSWWNSAVALSMGAMVFYWRLLLGLFLGLGVYIGLGLVVQAWLYASVQEALSGFVLNFVVFVLAWIGQFIGHKIEGAKPSFFEDLQFLFVGPAWLLQAVYRKYGLTGDHSQHRKGEDID